MTICVVKNVSLAAGAAVALLAGNALALAADAQVGDSQGSTCTATEESGTAAGFVAVEQGKVEGTFSFTQGEVTPTAVVARNFSGASATLCGTEAVAAREAVSYEDWAIEVTGEVSNPFCATLAEMSDEQGTASLVMGCSCLGNPVDGRASANADVLGISLASVIERAGVGDDVNTVVFTSADGYEVSLPLFYVKQHFTILAYELNGEAMANSMGGTCQLWLGSTAASYYARDVTQIRFEAREQEPDRPDAGDIGMTPSVSVVSGTDV